MADAGHQIRSLETRQEQPLLPRLNLSLAHFDAVRALCYDVIRNC
jgi:hypothetical protein